MSAVGDDTGWVERMAQRARERGPAGTAKAAYVAEHGEHVLSPDPPEDADVCRECCEWKPIGNWPGVYTWFRTCSFLSCRHAHHEDEIWLA